jgi:hypothetical protein
MSKIGKLVYKQKIYPLGYSFYIYLIPALLLAPLTIIGVLSGLYLLLFVAVNFLNLLVAIFWSIWFYLTFISINVAFDIYNATFIKIYDNGIEIAFSYEYAKHGNKDRLYFADVDRLVMKDSNTLQIICKEKKYDISLIYFDGNEIADAIINGKANFDRKYKLPDL